MSVSMPLALVGAGLLAGSPQDTELLSQLVERACRYVATYESALGALVADEHYEQVEVKNGAPQTRVTESEFMVVFIAAHANWRGFRDTHSVNGKSVRGARRLRRLFNPDGSVDADRLVKEAAAWNLGDRIYRNVNVPTLPLLFLRADTRSRFDLKLGDAALKQGVAVRGLRFKEKKSPTLIRNTEQEDVVSLGTYWIEPESGTIVATEHFACDVRTTTEGRIDVAYSRDPELGLWVPTQMTETYTLTPAVDPLNVIRCTANYSNFRRYTAKTREAFRLPETQDKP
jgi:hypothetical protein